MAVNVKQKNTGPATTPEVDAVDEEQARAMELIGKAVGAAVADAMAPIAKAVEELKAAQSAPQVDKSTNHMGDAGLENNGTQAKEVDPPKGIRLIRALKAGIIARSTSRSTVDVLKSQGYESEARRVKALGQGTFVDGGALVPTEYSTELIELLRNVTVLRKLGCRTIPIGATLEIPAQSAAAQAFYVGEHSAVTPSQPTFAGMRLSEKKMMALVPIGNDLIRNASIAAESIVRDDLVQVLALKEDTQGLFGVGSENAPRGAKSMIVSDNQYAGTASTANAPTLAEVKKELAKAKRKMKSGNIPMISLGWVMSPRTEEYLYSITDGNGNSVFQAALDAGMLHGAPVIVSNQIPENLGTGGDESPIFFGDWAQFVIGESQAMEIESFPNATYDNSGTIVSGISTDQTVIRAKLKHDFGMRYTNALVIVSVKWGAA